MSHNIDFVTYSRTGVLESISLSLTSQYHRQALTGIFEWNGQTFPPLRPPAYLLVRLVDEGNSGRIWESNDGGVAVYGGVVPGIDPKLPWPLTSNCLFHKVIEPS